MENERIKQIETLVNKLDSIIHELATIKNKEVNDLNNIKNAQSDERLESIHITIDKICLSVHYIHESIEHLENAASMVFETLVNKLDNIIHEVNAIKGIELNDLNSIKNSQGGEQQDTECIESMQITIDQIYLSTYCIYESIEHLEDAAGVVF